MTVRFVNIWIGIPVLLIPIAFILFMMILIRIWMFAAPKPERTIPNYSLHVMKEEKPDKPAKSSHYPMGFRPVYAARPQKYTAEPATYPADPPTYPQHAYEKKPQQAYRQIGQLHQQAAHGSTDHGTEPVQYGQSQLI